LQLLFSFNLESKLQNKIFKINEQSFNDVALEVFRFQSKNCAVYNKYLNLLGIKPENIKNWKEIPFLSIRFFKEKKVVSTTQKEEIVFYSSNTGSKGESKHYVKNLSLYEQSFTTCFETFFGDIPGVNPLASDVDNQDVPNVEVLLNQGRDWILDNPGRDSYFIFNGQDREAVTTLPDYYAPSLTAPGNNASKYKQLPIDWILDGVEVQPNVSADQIPKKLDANIDAGYIHVTDGSYSSQAVIRKTSGMSSGRKVLQDSNNSSNDFTVIKANPRGFAE